MRAIRPQEHLVDSKQVLARVRERGTNSKQGCADGDLQLLRRDGVRGNSGSHLLHTANILRQLLQRSASTKAVPLRGGFGQVGDRELIGLAALRPNSLHSKRLVSELGVR